MSQRVRTPEELIRKIQEICKEEDFLGVERGEYISVLDYQNAKPFLNKSVTEDVWNIQKQEYTVENILFTMQDYMDFAWGKANNCRGISANRSIKHYIAWIWLTGEDDFHKTICDEYKNNYQHYGKEILIMICDHYRWDWKQYDNGERIN